MVPSLAKSTRRCSAGLRCASHAVLGEPAKLSRGNPGTLCFACEERRAACELKKAAAPRRSRPEGGSEAGRRPPAQGDEPRLSGGGRAPAKCAKGPCRRPAVERQSGMWICKEHAEAGRIREWQEGRRMWALTCDLNLRDARASGDEESARKWSGLLEEAKARLAQAEADLAAAEARACSPQRRAG